MVVPWMLSRLEKFDNKRCAVCGRLPQPSPAVECWPGHRVGWRRFRPNGWFLPSFLQTPGISLGLEQVKELILGAALDDGTALPAPDSRFPDTHEPGERSLRESQFFAQRRDLRRRED